MYTGPMNLHRKARETLNDLSTASKQVVETSEWATIALVCVSVVSIAALVVGVMALNRSNRVNV